MTTFESNIKVIKHSGENIYKTLSDLNNLALVQDRIPKDKIKDLTFDTDTVSVTADKVGRITLRIINREAFSTIKFTVEGAPSDANLWIQIKEVGPNDTRMKLTLKASLNVMMKMTLKGKLKQFLDGFGDTLTSLDYSSLSED